MKALKVRLKRDLASHFLKKIGLTSSLLSMQGGGRIIRRLTTGNLSCKSVTENVVCLTEFAMCVTVLNSDSRYRTSTTHFCNVWQINIWFD